MLTTNALASIADLLTNAIVPIRQHALSDEELDQLFRAFAENASERRERYRRIIGPRERWTQLNEDELETLTRIVLAGKLKQRNASPAHEESYGA